LIHFKLVSLQQQSLVLKRFNAVRATLPLNCRACAY